MINLSPITSSTLSALLLFLSIFTFMGCNLETTNAERITPTAPEASAVRDKSPVLKPLVPTYEFGKYSFTDLAILEDGRTWSLGYDGENPRRLRLSKDGGKNWEVKILSPDFIMPGSIYFADGHHGWISGSGNIFRTTDGGESWNKVNLRRNLDFTLIRFFNNEIGYFVGKLNIQGEEASEVWITRDGGKTWNKSYENKKWQTPYSILTVSKDTTLVVLDEKNLIRTDNAGKSWQIVKSFDYSTNQLYKDKNSRIWTVGRDGIFFYSIDTGQTWNRPESFPELLLSKNWKSICFADSRIGFAAGDDGAFATTYDGGTTWRLIESNTTDSLSKIFVNKNIGLVIGADKLYKIEF